jgi:hypothetical protein
MMSCVHARVVECNLMIIHLLEHPKLVLSAIYYIKKKLKMDIFSYVNELYFHLNTFFHFCA